MSDKHGIKEIKELVAGLKVLKEIGKEAMEDGKVDWADTLLLAKVGANMPVLMDAFNGLDMLDDELKELSEAEAKEVLGLLYNI